MDLNPAMSYRITTLEIEQAAIRAERARMVAEHSEQIVRRDGLVRRMLRRVAGRGPLVCRGRGRGRVCDDVRGADVRGIRARAGRPHRGSAC